MIFQEIFIHTFEKNGRRPTLRERLDMRKYCGPYRWTPTEPGKGRGFYQSSRGLQCGDSTFDLRLRLANDVLHEADRMRRLQDINGYYADTDGDQTVVPIVALLPHGRGFLAGYTYGAGMCAAIESHVYPDAESAAIAAHSVAEYQAELAIEADERNNEEEEVTEND